MINEEFDPPSSRVGTAEESLPACFNRVVAMHGSRIALAAGRWSPTYRELNCTANRLAHGLLGQREAAGGRVAILMRHDTPLIAAMLGVLKARRVVLVLNPTDPPARLRQLLEDAAPDAILFDESNHQLSAEIGSGKIATICFEDMATRGVDENPEVNIPAGDIAFLVYTSGSTGRPKAVMQTHRQVFHNATRLSRVLQIAAEDRIALFASLSGTQGVATTWCGLVNGASVLPFPALEQGVGGIAVWMQDEKVSVYISAASLFRHVMKSLNKETRFPRIRVVRLASETATSNDFEAYQRHFLDHCSFVHTLSSSETGNIAHLCLSRSDVVANGRLPSGHVFDEVEVRILDDKGEMVAPDEIGEIVVRGNFLSSGYWRNEKLTAERFSSGPGTLRSFRTGDLGRINLDGLLVFVGRRDVQVKIRGYRVELSEVEEALRRLPGVDGAAVAATETENYQSQLVAYVVMRGKVISPASKLRRGLRAVLPDHMIPTRFAFLESLPLAPSGKIDRQKLQHIPNLAMQQSPARSLETSTEFLLAKVWSEIFEKTTIRGDDDFFELGGDSLIAAVVSAKIEAILGVELNIGKFAKYPTLSALARAIDELRQGIGIDLPAMIRVPRDRPVPLSYFQERAWDAAQTPQGLAGYVGIARSRILGPLDREALCQCMQYLVERHESLRTTFAIIDGQPVQVVHPKAPINLPFIDLNGVLDVERQASLLLKQEAAHISDLSQLPLMRLVLVRISENEHWLMRAAHHIIYDAWSWKVYLEELASLYDAQLRGQQPTPPALQQLQYADFAAWQRSALDPGGRSFQAMAEWWKDHLIGAPRVLELRCRRMEPSVGVDPSQGRLRWGLDPETSRLLHDLQISESTTYYIVRLAAFVVLLALESGQPDVVLGTYVTNRNSMALQNVIGFFVNLVTLRFRPDGETTFREWLSIIGKGFVEAEARSQIPYEEMRKEFLRHDMTAPDIQVIFSIAPRRKPIQFADLQISWLDPYFDSRIDAMPWGFSMNLDENDEHLNCVVTFDANLYEPIGVRRLVRRYLNLLDTVSRNPDVQLATLGAD